MTTRPGVRAACSTAGTGSNSVMAILRQCRQPMRLRPATLRHWVIVVFATVGLGLLPWTIWLSASLVPHHETDHWDLAWSGFDSALAVLFLATALAAYRRSTWVGAL